MLALRPARANDLDALRGLMARAIATLQRDFLTPAQIEASRAVMGLDSQLIADGTYFVVEAAGDLAGCGGWSRRMPARRCASRVCSTPRPTLRASGRCTLIPAMPGAASDA